MLKTIIIPVLSFLIVTGTANSMMALLPNGFAETEITGNGLSNPTAIALHPDGRIFGFRAFRA